MIPKEKLEDIIKESLIIQWSKDTKGEIRRRNQRMTDKFRLFLDQPRR